jgi:hypothetical protein
LLTPSLTGAVTDCSANLSKQKTNALSASNWVCHVEKGVR